MAIRLRSPYRSDGFQWLRGNLHTHTDRSDGAFSPEQVLAEYAGRGYDFLALSDHDRLVPPEEFQDRTALILLPALEVSANGPHMLAVGIREPVAPDPDRQKAVDETNALGGFAVLNHPNWQHHYNHFPQDQMEQLIGYAGIEIYNGVIERLEGSPLATDRWDRLLAGGRRVWGYAHDDAHREGDFGRGWIVAQAPARSAAAIVEALREGRFYASTGVTVERVEADGPVLSVIASDAQRIRFYGAWGRELRSVEDGRAEYSADGSEGGYVRAECLGAGGRTAWTQPAFVECL